MRVFDGLLVSPTPSMAPPLFIIIFFFYQLLSALALLSSNGVNFEVRALMGAKSRFMDRFNVMGGWDINSVDPCTWNLVACSSDGFVISLEMASKGLSGSLSPTIADLTHLQTLLLQNNEINGSIPTEIGKLSNLQTLDLSSNRFDGDIPKSIASLPDLTYVRLGRNKLSGEIPKDVANMRGLSFLDLSFNNLTGPIPKIFAKDYRIMGNYFLCNDISGNCVGGLQSINGSSSGGGGSREVNHVHKWVVVAIMGLMCAFLILLFFPACWIYFYRTRVLSFGNELREGYDVESKRVVRFSLKELEIATNNFSRKNVIGRGGYGVVYKGVLSSKMVVAVKRLTDVNTTGESQFQTEVEIIGLALHRNLLKLYGFCTTPTERLLVYPYMPHGSLSDRLRDRGSALEWRRRVWIAVGAARGLAYLHEECEPKIIHRDVKAANILLDRDLEAVVGDLGLAKLMDLRDSHVTTAVRGTPGHIPPEYLLTGHSSEKTDVFAFGMLLLDLVVGLRSSSLPKPLVLDRARRLREEKRVEEMVDGEIKESCSIGEVEEVVALALRCTLSNPVDRPVMSQVLKLLQAVPGEDAPPHPVTRSGRRGYGSGSTLSRNLSAPLEDDHSIVIDAIELSGPR